MSACCKSGKKPLPSWLPCALLSARSSYRRCPKVRPFFSAGRYSSHAARRAMTIDAAMASLGIEVWFNFWCWGDARLGDASAVAGAVILPTFSAPQTEATVIPELAESGVEVSGGPTAGEMLKHKVLTAY